MSTPTYSGPARRARGEALDPRSTSEEPIELMIQRIINGLDRLEMCVVHSEDRVATQRLVQEMMEQAQNTLIRSFQYREKRRSVDPEAFCYANGERVNDFGLGFDGVADGVNVCMVFDGEYCSVGIPVEEARRLRYALNGAIIDHMNRLLHGEGED